MKKETVIQLHRSFEQIVNTDPGSGVQYWRARAIFKVC